MERENKKNADILVKELMNQRPDVFNEVISRLMDRPEIGCSAELIGDIGTSDLVDEVNQRLIKDNSLDLDLVQFEGAKYRVDQTCSGKLTPDSIEVAIDELVSRGAEPSFAIVPRDKQMEVRRGDYFTSCTRKYVQNGLIGNYMDISVIVSTDVNNAYVVEGDLDADKTPDQICEIILR